MTANEHADVLIASAPCSAVLPAGAGKTELLARAAIGAITNELSVLFLTHTNAGTAAFRRRLLQLGARPSGVDSRTISSFAERWCRSYPTLAGLAPEAVESMSHGDYAEPAVRVLNSSAIQSVVAATWDLVLVDEHQDADPLQHEVIVAISRAVRTIVVGDPLQAVFNFPKQPTIQWTEVTKAFPPVELRPVAHRWSAKNPKLGLQLLEVRDLLIDRQPVDLRTFSEIGWQKDHPAAVITQVGQLTRRHGTSAVVAQYRQQCVALAKKAGGRIFALEDLHGTTLADAVAKLDAATAGERVGLIAELADKSISKLPNGLIQRLKLIAAGGDVNFKLASKLGPITVTAQQACGSDYPGELKELFQAIGGLDDIVVARRELWEGLGLVLTLAEQADCGTFVEAFEALSADRARGHERAADRIAATPLLVKGLEYDHVLVVAAHKLSREELYVALTRARSSVCVLSDQPVLRP